MKAIHYPTCQRCGYRYNPKKKIRVLVFKCDDGDYIACENCISELGRLEMSGASEDEKNAFIAEFKEN